MEWPSNNISHGGILHPAKVKYCSETQQYLQLLINECKLSTSQRKNSNYFLRSEKPLGLNTQSSSSRTDVTSLKKSPLIKIRPNSSKRRTFESILQSGAYERENFIPIHPKVDREIEKRRLQNKMAHVENETKRKKPTKPKPEGNSNRFDQLVQEIKEREDWMKQMIEVGDGKKFEQIIQQQIEARVREMEKLSLKPL